MKKHLSVIGSGIGGLAIAIRMVRKGYQVDVYEQQERAGGKLSQIEHNGYRFDTGPSLFTLPNMVDELYSLCGKEAKDFFTYSPLEIVCKYFYPDKTEINSYSDQNRFATEVLQKLNVETNTVKRFLKRSETIYELTKEVFLFNAFQSIPTLFRASSWNALFNFWKLDPFRTMHRANSAMLKDTRLVQLFDRYATYNGSNPYKAPATLNVISHLEHNIGAFFPDKGMYHIVESLYNLALEQGVKFHFNSKVEEVRVEKGKVKGFVLNGELIPASTIISDIDIHTFNKLLPESKFHFHSKADHSTSALIFYWCMKVTFNRLQLHNILFARDYKAEFNDLFIQKEIHHDPTVYIFISSKSVKKDAPEGGENWFVMVNAPENVGQDWDEAVSVARKRIKEKIKSFLEIDVDKYIDFEYVASPVTIEQNTGSYHGSLYGVSSNSTMSAFTRHPNFHRKVKGLYFVGGSVHPGGGIPLCLASAKIVAKMFK